MWLHIINQGGIRVKLIIKNTSLTDKELDGKILKKLIDRIDQFDNHKKYAIEVNFCEAFLENQNEIDGYEIPEEYLKEHEKEKNMTGKEKTDMLLDYRINSIANLAKEYEIKLDGQRICGTTDVKIDEVEVIYSFAF